MNNSDIKPLVQIQRNEENPDLDHLSVTLLVDENTLQALLDKCREHPDKRAALVVQMPHTHTDLAIEVYRPHEFKNLRYVENLKRDGKEGWTTLVVATL